MDQKDLTKDDLERLASIIDEIEGERKQVRLKSRKVSTLQVLQCAMNVLDAVISWKQLDKLKEMPDVTYKAIYKRFSNWVKNGIITEAFKRLRNCYYFPALKDKYAAKDLYIDTTYVKNIHGTEDIGRNPTDRGRMGSKVSVIVDCNRIPLSNPVIFPANVADPKTVDKTLESLELPFTDNRRVIRLAGDKAYNLKKEVKERLYQLKIRMVVEKKKTRDQESLRPKDKHMHKNRVKVEHTFSHYKRIYRLRCRLDAKSNMYLSFWYLRAMQLMFNEIRRQNAG